MTHTTHLTHMAHMAHMTHVTQRAAALRGAAAYRTLP